MERLSDSFVDYVFERISKDKGFRADLRRADNKAYEANIWPVLNRFIGNLDDSSLRMAYAMVGAAIGKSGYKANGTVGLGRAFWMISGKESGDDFSPRFMRILSSDNIDDLLQILRPSLSFILSAGINLDFKRLLSDLISYRYGDESRDRIRASWASDYLRREEAEDA